MKKIILAITISCMLVSCEVEPNYESYFNIKVTNSSGKDLAIKVSTDVGDTTHIFYGVDTETNITLFAPRKWIGVPFAIHEDPRLSFVNIKKYEFYVLDDTTSFKVIFWGDLRDGVQHYDHNGNPEFEKGYMGEPVYDKGYKGATGDLMDKCALTLITANIGEESSFVNWIVNYTSDGISLPYKDNSIEAQCREVRLEKDYTMLRDFYEYYMEKAIKENE